VNHELRELLIRAGYDAARAPDAWRRVVVINNFGSVPIPADRPVDFAQSGFKLLLLGASGRPTHFARCGALTDRVLAREGRILETLSGQPGLAQAVPATRTVQSPVLRLVLNAYLPGRSYQQFVARRSAARWVRDVIEILELRSQVGVRAAEAMPDLLDGGATVSPAAEAAPRLRALRSAGIEAREVEAAERVLEAAGELPRTLQHGDLWPGNVVRHRGSWWLIDFAEFAQVQVPLYDMFHMLQSNPGRRSLRLRHLWLMLGEGALDDEWTGAAREVVRLRAAERGLDVRQVVGALVYYLVHISAYRLRAGVPRQFGEAFVRELLRVTGELRRGLPPEELISLGR